MKIAYLINQYPKVSHSFIRREIHALERRGAEVLRIAVRGWDGDLVDTEDLAERARTHYVLERGAAALSPRLVKTLAASPQRFLAALRLALRMSRSADRSLPYHLVYLAEACWIAALLAQHGSEHLHAHFGTNPAEVAMLVHALCGIPYSFTVHGMDEVDRAPFLGLGEKIARSAFAVAVSSFGRSQLFRWTEQQHWHKVKVVHCGLDSVFYESVPVRVPSTLRLICVGRLSPEKGQLLLLEAAAMLAREGVEFELVLAGDGEMRGPLEAAIAEHGLRGQVRLTGWLTNARVREEIQAARALVLPSLIEGLPVVIMEAMALRRAVLATYVGGIPELVVHGETGWLVPAGSVHDLAAAMKACLGAAPEVLDRMGAAARERVLERHDVDREGGRLVELFREAAVEPRLTSDTVTRPA